MRYCRAACLLGLEGRDLCRAYDKAADAKLIEGLVSFTGSDALHAVESGVRRCDAAELFDAPTTCRSSYSESGLQPRRVGACRTSGLRPSSNVK